MMASSRRVVPRKELEKNGQVDGIGEWQSVKYGGVDEEL